MADGPRLRLGAWIDRQRITQAALAAEVGISAAFLSDILHGKKKPGAATAHALEARTGIPAEDWNPWREELEALRARGSG